MDEESKYRVEKDDEEHGGEQERKGFLRPLPEPEKPVRTTKRGKGAVTKLLGITMYERTRDAIIILVMPLFVGLISLVLFVLVLMSGRRELRTWVFCCLLLSVALNALLTFGMRSSSDVNQALVWERPLIVFGFATFVFYYHFGISDLKLIINYCFVLWYKWYKC